LVSAEDNRKKSHSQRESSLDKLTTRRWKLFPPFD
jgi:hypothetical protein